MKKNQFKKIWFLSFLILSALILGGPALAADAAPGRTLEVTYPSVIGQAPTTTGTPPGQFIVYLVNFAIWGSGFIALLVIVIGGLRYLASAGNPEIMQESKNQITAALSGLLILVSIYLILGTINPELTNLQLPSLPYKISQPEEGVWVCKENVPFVEVWNKTKNPPENIDKSLKDDVDKAFNQIKQQCLHVNAQGDLDKDFNNKVRYVFIASTKQTQYGVILYEEENFAGRAAIIYGDGASARSDTVVDWNLTRAAPDLHPSSLMPFIMDDKPVSSSYVKLYERISYNSDETISDAKTQPLAFEGKIVNYTKINLPPAPTSVPEIGSIRIVPVGQIIAIFFRSYKELVDWTLNSQIDVYIQSDRNLNGKFLDGWDGINTCKKRVSTSLSPVSYPCAEAIVIVSARIF